METLVALRHRTVFGARRACIGALSLLLPAVAGATEIWLPTSLTNAPVPRTEHTAVWTGARMIVWGGETGSGSSLFDSGGIYDPATDTWEPTSLTNAPTPRSRHTAVWTGSRMIVWGGGWSSRFNSGGIYDPATDTWTATSTTNAPEGRTDHTAVWTGSKMIVWGGIGTGGVAVPSGGIYDPATDTWTATSTTNAPTARWSHTAMWTGSKMIVWGGADTGLVPFSSGGIYDPATDTWTATSTTNVPTARWGHTAVWTGSRVIVWGGVGAAMGVPLPSGGIYDPATDTWTATSTTNAPTARYNHTAVWAGSKMIVWAGFDGSMSLNSGALYDSSSDVWTATSTTNAPTRRNAHAAVWTGSKMMVWGGNDGMTPANTGGTYEDVPSVPSAFYTLSPCRVADTRNAAGPSGGPALAAYSIRIFPVTGAVCGIPSTASAVSVNLTAVEAAAAGHLILYPGDAVSPPLVSNINFSPGLTRANNAVVPLATDGTGTIKVKNGSAGAVHFVLDVSGYFQ
jgi:N-acetylneuraminic acid mutarotase